MYYYDTYNKIKVASEIINNIGDLWIEIYPTMMIVLPLVQVVFQLTPINLNNPTVGKSTSKIHHFEERKIIVIIIGK